MNGTFSGVNGRSNSAFQNKLGAIWSNGINQFAKILAESFSLQNKVDFAV